MKKIFLSLALFSSAGFYSQTYQASAGANTTICEGDSVTLTASAGLAYNMSVSAPSSMNYTFQGDFSGNNPSITAEVGSILSFNVQTQGHPFWLKTASNTGTTNAIPGIINNGITNGTINWTPTTPGTYYYICQFHSMMVGTITISASSSTPSYSWSPGGLTTPSITVSPTSTTNYTVAAFDSLTAQQASDVVTVFVNPAPAVGVITNLTVCQGDTIIINNGTQLPYIFTYCCSIFEGVPFTLNQTTTITYTATDPQTGCSTDGVFIIFVDPLPTISGISSQNQVLCPGDTTSPIVWSPSNTYSWINSNLDIGLANQGSGTQIDPFIAQNQFSQVQVATIIITPTFNQCTGTPDTATITVNPVSIIVLNETAIDSFTLNGQTYTQTGIYTQTLTNSYGCDSIITLNLSLNFSGLNESNFQSIAIYPNPVKNYLTIQGLNISELQRIFIANNQGKIIDEIEMVDQRVNLSHLKNGIYFLQIHHINGIKNIKLIKE